MSEVAGDGWHASSPRIDLVVSLLVPLACLTAFEGVLNVLAGEAWDGSSWGWLHLAAGLALLSTFVWFDPLFRRDRVLVAGLLVVVAVVYAIWSPVNPVWAAAMILPSLCLVLLLLVPHRET